MGVRLNVEGLRVLVSTGSSEIVKSIFEPILQTQQTRVHYERVCELRYSGGTGTRAPEPCYSRSCALYMRRAGSRRMTATRIVAHVKYVHQSTRTNS